MKLREIRTQKRYKQNEIAEQIGVSPAAVHHWETGACEPSIANLKKLAEVLDCTVDDLLKDQEAGDGESERAEANAACG